ncbi:hypothetical protein SAMD00020551_4972 [Mesobacillus selenatarsenatis SF-1]|uniref:Uncharacterized protein n=1 Tax=Mesobacillus selenatarsenatis (strain DSM 18680 / JCM 14380 / FERM P-15431 / SF-1) TaxID=1321606 RepID=A0A0A8XCJ3_MESS1|nr:hypothetical protein SAMD00020551_4972 [Mesobacillus selenatarsenatis SF-1]
MQDINDLKVLTDNLLVLYELKFFPVQFQITQLDHKKERLIY